MTATADQRPEADAALLRRVIRASGLSARSFAERVLVRDERTVRRWIAGTSPMPAIVAAKLRELLREYGESAE